MTRDRELSRREREIMDVLHRLGQATVADVRANLFDPPSYSATRSLLAIMEEKGHVVHAEKGRAYVYRTAGSAQVARRAALRHVVSTFFGGSVEEAAAALVDLPDAGLNDDTRKRLARRIAQARKEGR